MKKIISICLVCILVLTSCGKKDEKITNNTEKTVTEASNHEVGTLETETKDKSNNILSEEEYIEQQKFTSLNSPELLSYVENRVYEDVEKELASDDYKIESVQATYISNEFFEELNYNSKENVFFGYNISDVEKAFEGKKYAFTLGEDGQTTVVELEELDVDIYNKVFTNVAIGTGVILVCVTLSMATGGVASAVFMASAKTGASFAVSSGVFGGAVNGIVKYIQTGDKEQALEAMALEGSEAFKWGAISGVLVGGASEASFAMKLPKDIRKIQYTDLNKITPRESEILAEYFYKAEGQVSYLGGKVVPTNTLGATRPDCVRNVNGVLEAIEVKNYNLYSKASISTLKSELRRQIGSRVENLPQGSIQRIALQDRGYTNEFKEAIIKELQGELGDIYANIPIDFIGKIPK